MSTTMNYPTYPVDAAQNYREAGYWRGETLGDMLQRVSDQYPNRIAVVEGEQALTYEQLNLSANKLAHGLLKLGLNAGDSVVMQLPNGIRFVQTLFALFRIGVIPVMALPTDRITEIRHIFEVSGASCYITQDRAQGFDYSNIARDLAQSIAFLEHIVVVGDAGPFTSYESLFLDPIPLPKQSASDAALIMLSGGSTALPKLIVRTHDDYFYSFRASADICQLNQNSVYLCVLPAGHNFTLSSPGILGVLCVGGKIVMSTDPSGSAAFSAIAKEKVTFTAVVPSLALAWLHAQVDTDLSSLSFIQVGGAKLGAETATHLMEHLGCRLQQVYGMSEGLVCYTRLDDSQETVIGTQGRPISSADEIRIVDERDQILPAGETGQLLTRGPYTIRGYLNAPDHNQRAFTADGFYRTGDLVRFTKDGNLIVEGRVKDQVNRGGEKIAAEELEVLLLRHPDVREVAVIGVPDRYLGEATCVVVVPLHDEKVNSKTIKRFVREHGVATYKVPDVVHFVSELPKTPLGKIDKKALRQHYAKSLSDENQIQLVT